MMAYISIVVVKVIARNQIVGILRKGKKKV